MSRFATSFGYIDHRWIQSDRFVRQLTISYEISKYEVLKYEISKYEVVLQVAEAKPLPTFVKRGLLVRKLLATLSR
jgi:hypothetical protein